MALEDRLAQVKTDLTEASTELVGLIAELRTELQNNGFTAAAAESLASIETMATNLKNVVETPGAKQT